MNYAKQNKEDVAFVKMALSGDQHGYTLLFDRYFDIVKLYLYKNFRHVRDEVLQDVAIITLEDWLLNISEDNCNVDKIGFKLCRQAKHKVFRILQPKFKNTAFTDLYSDQNEEDYFINQTVYKIIADGYDADIAKITFQLKTKVDQYISELPDEDYNVITLFLQGERSVDIEKKLNLTYNSAKKKITKAFTNLKKLMDGRKKGIYGYKKKIQEYNTQYHGY